MRDLHQSELQAVSGAGGCYTPPPCCDCAPSSKKQKKGNNGFGNGADFNNTPPGQSGFQEPVNNGNGWGKRDSRGTDLGPR